MGGRGTFAAGKNVAYTYETVGFIDGVKILFKKSKSSGKEKGNDTPSWAKGQKPNKGESGKDFADRLCDERYGKGNYKTGPGTEHNKIQKYGDRGGKQ